MIFYGIRFCVSTLSTCIYIYMIFYGISACVSTLTTYIKYMVLNSKKRQKECRISQKLLHRDDSLRSFRSV